ncbi:MAG: molybdate ABC transporter permease subunit, partial [Sphingomonas sp.]
MLTAAEWDVLALSVLIAGRAVLGALPVALLAGWMMARTRFPGRTLLDAVLHSSLFLPPVVVGLGLILLFG